MENALHDRRIVLGVTGSIACFKAADLASKLVQQGAAVDVILTDEAARFVTPLTFQALTHRPVITDLFDPRAETAMDHVALGLRADLIVICPATAHTIARLSLGLADDALTTTVLAATAPLVIVPAMDVHMFQHVTVQEHLQRLRSRSATIVGPVEGRMASGLVGKGRMTEVAEILDHLRHVLGQTTGDLRGRTLVVTAGGTQEPLDPVRVITNRSSGKMGYAIAEAARDRGARTVLVTAPTSLPNPAGVEVVQVHTAAEMRDAVLKASQSADALIMAAAVSDYRPVTVATHKMKKGTADWIVELTQNPDILTDVTGPRVKVGFAAETDDLIPNARRKLIEKSLDLIVANDVSAPDGVFGADENKVVIIDRAGAAEELPLQPKSAVARRILDRVADLLTRSGAAGTPTPPA
ncbi:MAG: bifunctional phosphopantothenoylcysteine decarboxylase/phosphopantothenate--cysteine ligase CoaBC [Armatimonadota bacterium]